MKSGDFDHLVLDSLLRRVRVLSRGQIAEMAGATEACAKVRRRLRSLKERGLVHSFQVDIQILQLKKPLDYWSPTDRRHAQFGKIAWQARRRFLHCESQRTQLFFASNLAQRTHGGVGGKVRQPNQLMHDLGTASLFVRKRSTRPRQMSEWVSEDMLRRFYRHLGLKKIPDAALVRDGELVTAIEFAGRDYSRKYLQRFHDYWKSQRTPYEIW